MGYFQYPTLHSVNYVAGDNKAAALIPGAAHDRRAATEPSPESAEEIGCAARRGGCSGWRPSMMNEATDVHHCCRCFPLVFVGAGARSCLLMRNNIIKPTNMIISNGALQLATGSPAYGGIIIPEHYFIKAAASAAVAAEKVRRGLCTKNDRVCELI